MTVEIVLIIELCMIKIFGGCAEILLSSGLDLCLPYYKIHGFFITDVMQTLKVSVIETAFLKHR